MLATTLALWKWGKCLVEMGGGRGAFCQSCWHCVQGIVLRRLLSKSIHTAQSGGLLSACTNQCKGKCRPNAARLKFQSTPSQLRVNTGVKATQNARPHCQKCSSV